MGNIFPLAHPFQQELTLEIKKSRKAGEKSFNSISEWFWESDRLLLAQIVNLGCGIAQFSQNGFSVFSMSRRKQAV